jgi:hypothetical protein
MPCSTKFGRSSTPVLVNGMTTGFVASQHLLDTQEFKVTSESECNEDLFYVYTLALLRWTAHTMAVGLWLQTAARPYIKYMEMVYQKFV